MAMALRLCWWLGDAAADIDGEQANATCWLGLAGCASCSDLWVEPLPISMAALQQNCLARCWGVGPGHHQVSALQLLFRTIWVRVRQVHLAEHFTLDKVTGIQQGGGDCVVTSLWKVYHAVT
jgi:hypothetical protein